MFRFVKETQIKHREERDFVDHKFLRFCQELTVQQFGDRHSNTIEPASWLVQVFCDFKTTRHQEVSVSLKYTVKTNLADIFYLFVERTLSIFAL